MPCTTRVPAPQAPPRYRDRLAGLHWRRPSRRPKTEHPASPHPPSLPPPLRLCLVQRMIALACAPSKCRPPPPAGPPPVLAPLLIPGGGRCQVPVGARRPIPRGGDHPMHGGGAPRTIPLGAPRPTRLAPGVRRRRPIPPGCPLGMAIPAGRPWGRAIPAGVPRGRAIPAGGALAIPQGEPRAARCRGCAVAWRTCPARSLLLSTQPPLRRLRRRDSGRRWVRPVRSWNRRGGRHPAKPSSWRSRHGPRGG